MICIQHCLFTSSYVLLPSALARDNASCSAAEYALGRIGILDRYGSGESYENPWVGRAQQPRPWVGRTQQPQIVLARIFEIPVMLRWYLVRFRVTR